MHMAVQGPTATPQLSDDAHRGYILSQTEENMQKWKKEAEESSDEWNRISDNRVKKETEERNELRNKFLTADTEVRRKLMEKEGERGGMMNGINGMNGQFQHHQGMPPMMVPMAQQGMPPMYAARMGQPMHPNMQQMHQMQQMGQQQGMGGGHPSPALNGNGAESTDQTNSRKRTAAAADRASTTPNHDNHPKMQRMMDGSSNPYGYPQGVMAIPPFPVHSHYPMVNGGPYAERPAPSQYNPPACQMQQQQQQQQQQHPQHQTPSPQSGMMHPVPFPSQHPSTSAPTTVQHQSPLASTTVPPSSSSQGPSSQSNGTTMNGSHDDLDTFNTDNLDVMVNQVMGDQFSGQALGDLGADIGLGDDEWDSPSTSNGLNGGGAGPSSLPPPQSNGNGVVIPTAASSSSAPHSNRMPTPGGSEDHGGPSTSTHQSPMNGYHHPSPHSAYPMHNLMNTVNSIGQPQDNGQSMSSSSSLPPPRTPNTSTMGPPSDSSTPYPHMSHSSSIPPHLQSSFPLTTSSHTQPGLLKMSPPLPHYQPMAGHPMHSLPPLQPAPVVQAPPPKKSRAKKPTKQQQLAQQQQQQQQAQPLQSPHYMPGPGMHPGMYGMGHPSAINQFAPPPSMQAPSQTMDGGAGGVPMTMQQQQYQQMMMARHQQMMAIQQQQMMHMRQNGMVPPTSAAPGSLPSPAAPNGMVTVPPGGRPPMQAMQPSPQGMMMPNTPQALFMMQQQHNQIRMQQQMRYQHTMATLDPQQQAQYHQQFMVQQHQQQQQMAAMQQQAMQQQQMQQVHQQQQQQQQGGSAEGSPMMGVGSAPSIPTQNGMTPSSQSVSSPYTAPSHQMSPAFSHTSAPFPFPGQQFPTMNPSQ